MSVVVVTRNRPVDLERCLLSILEQAYPGFDLTVVDQSDNQASAEVVDRLSGASGRIGYIRDRGRGAARGRNLGADATRGDLIVFTDDDCQAQPGWLTSLVQAVQADTRAGLAYGAVIPAPHDCTRGFIVGFTPKRPTRLTGRLAKLRDAGISANLVIRRAAFCAIGGFDEMLGPGSYFPCAEDFDLTYRGLGSGYAVLHVPDSRVIHHGFRDWGSGGPLVHATYVAIGAAYMKHIRMNDLIGLALLAKEFWAALVNIAAHVFRGRGPFGFGRLRGLMVGARRSYELRIERRHAVYHMPS